VPGRLEKLSTPDSGVDVYVDYAHMPEDVETTMAAVREIAGSRRVIAVMGCTTRTSARKRPIVARTAMEGSDLCILTSDDPGREHPASIVMDMLRGVPRVGADRLKVVIDRATAVDAAVREALPDGIVVLMGKGILEETLRRADRHSVAGALREVSTAYELNHR
jgi:UDP-N-acetylmuramoyl-L-alanyl-D-glutamate--2,6-diaminopimelate ligase